MVDADWADYQKALTVFPRVADFQGMLSVDNDALDHVTATYWAVSRLYQCSKLQGLRDALVKRYSLGISWDVTKSWEMSD